MMISICLLPLWDALLNHQVGLIQAPFRILFIPWVLECVRFYVHPVRVKCISYSPLTLLEVSHTGLQSQTLWGILSLLPDPPTELPDVGLRTFTLLG